MADVVAIQLETQIQWHASRSPTSQRWIGVCDAMNLVMEAESLDELHSVINETMQLLLTDLLVDDELDRYLEERGWRAVNAPSVYKGRDVTFDVPWELVAEGALDTERRAH